MPYLNPDRTPARDRNTDGVKSHPQAPVKMPEPVRIPAPAPTPART